MTNGLNRQLLIESEEFAPIKEALNQTANAYFESGIGNYDYWWPIRATPLSTFYDKSSNALAQDRMNPYLPAIWKDKFNVRIGDYAKGRIQETVSIPNSLTTLKVSDSIIEGAEPYSDWKMYTRLENMDTPRQNVPKTRYTFNVGGQNADVIDIFAEGGTGSPPPLGGRVETIELDVSGTKNSYRGTIEIARNDVKDNNFLAVEQAYKNAGNNLYYLVGKKLIDVMVTGITTNTDDRDDLDFATPDHKYLEALIKVIRSKFKGDQRNTADSMFINPSDASEIISTAHADGGPWPFLDKRILRQDNDSDVVNNSGLAAALGLRSVWETPQITAGTVLITKKDVISVTGLREDLTIENLDQTIGGKYNSELVIRFETKLADENGGYKITNFTA